MKPMNLRLVMLAFAVSASAFGQNPIADVFYQIKYASNLNVGDSVFNLSNSGANNANFCANVYVFSPDEQMISCCACPITPNALVSLSARNDLTSNTLTPAVPSSIVVKIITTQPTTCNAAAVALVGNPIVNGLLAWGTTIHATPVAGTFGVTETPFTASTLSSGELARITALCGFIQANGSGFGICRSCRLGGLGASKQ